MPSGAPPTDLWPRLEPLLPQVQKPARYIGCEDGMQTPEHGPDKTSWLFTYPDTYEIGLPNAGLQILYEIINERPDAAAERSYAPWVDMEELLRREGLPLFSVDTHKPAGEFDIIAENVELRAVVLFAVACAYLSVHLDSFRMKRGSNYDTPFWWTTTDLRRPRWECDPARYPDAQTSKDPSSIALRAFRVFRTKACREPVRPRGEDEP